MGERSGSSGTPPDKRTTEVILFKPSGKYYTVERWRVPIDAIGPYDMERSPDFRRIDHGPVYVSGEEWWGYPHLFPGETCTCQLIDVSLPGEVVFIRGSHCGCMVHTPAGEGRRVAEAMREARDR